MNSETQPQCHEFWLRKYPEEYGGSENIGIFRVAIGDLIDAFQRETYKPPEGSHSPDFWNKSGSIGFMDFSIEKQLVPKVGANPYPDSNHEYSYEDCEEIEALKLQTIGIEPEYRRKGYARLLTQRLVEIASERGLVAIVADMIENPAMREWAIKLGCVPYDGGMRAVIRIER